MRKAGSSSSISIRSDRNVFCSTRATDGRDQHYYSAKFRIDFIGKHFSSQFADIAEQLNSFSNAHKRKLYRRLAALSAFRWYMTFFKAKYQYFDTIVIN
jgi:hypothetical protein